MEPRIGIVSSIEVVENALTARVKMTDRGGAVSPPMFILVSGSKDNKSVWTPKVNEQVAYLSMDGGRSGVILGAIYSARDTTPDDLRSETVTGTVFADGSRAFFDESNSTLVVDARSNVTVTADDEISATVDTCEVKLTAAEIIAKKGTTQVKVAAKVSIKTAAGSLFTNLDGELTQLIAETHVTPLGPTSPPINAPAYTAIKTNLGLVMEA